MTRVIDVFNKSDTEQKREMLINYFSNWAEVGDSYIYDLNRVKEAFELGTMSLDDFAEWDKPRVKQLVDEFLEWMFSPAPAKTDENFKEAL